MSAAGRRAGERVRVLLVGDTHRGTSGLGRVLGDWARTLLAEPLVELAGLHLYHPQDADAPWDSYPTLQVQDENGWGAADLREILLGHTHIPVPDVVFTIWDPARVYEMTVQVGHARRAGLRVELWGYFAVDAEAARGGFGGPAAQALMSYNRVLGYSAWGARVLARAIKRACGEARAVPWLPHALRVEWFEDEDWEGAPPLFGAPLAGTARPARWVGVVATNQPRKDLALAFGAVAAARAQDPALNLGLWLHTDELVRYWSVPQLVEEYGAETWVHVTTPGDGADDSWMRGFYRRCAVTLGVGLGEGWGYPTAESLACGTPVVAVAGSTTDSLVPRPEWRVRAETWRVEGAYALLRPVVSAEEAGAALVRAVRLCLLGWGPELTAAYCRGAVAHLEESRVRPLWGSWVGEGVAGVLAAQAAVVELPAGSPAVTSELVADALHNSP